MRTACALIGLITLGGCSILPNDGPSTHAFDKPAGIGGALYALVDLDYAKTQRIADTPPVAFAGLGGQSSDAAIDLIAEGDGLSVSVLEAGSGGLFPRPIDGASPSGNSPQTFPRLVVDSDGDLSVPFAGPVHVAGLTPREAAARIQKALSRIAVDPQVSVTVADSRDNSVTVIGEVRNAGHVPVSIHNDRLLDALASAGGPTRQPADLEVMVVRGARHVEAPLAELLANPAENIRLAPQDQVRVIYRPRRYSTFGAVGRVTQSAIQDDTLTLAGAISAAGGLDTTSANASAVMIFRFERPDVAAALGVPNKATPKGVPIIYRLNLRRPDGFFIANNFDIRSDDMLYVPRSDITEAEKFLTVVNTATQISYNIRVSNVIP